MMSTALKPVRDIGPEFARRLDHEIQRFSRRMFEIGASADRFETADAIQAECDRLAQLSDEEAGHAARRA